MLFLTNNRLNLAFYKQFFASLTTLLLHFSLGVCQGFSAVLIPQLQSPNSEIQATADDISWIASVCVISMPVGALFVGFFMELCGRKKVIQVSFIPLLIGWLVIAFADSVFMICVGRIVTGFAIAMDPAVIIYIAETNVPRYRSVLLSLTGPTVLIGCLTAYLLGHYLYWRVAGMVLSIFSGFCFLLIFIIPESPVWLISQNDIEGAEASLKWLRSETEVVNAELDELLQARFLKNQNPGDASFFAKIIKTKAWKPFLILTTFFFLQQFCGCNIILAYAVNFYEALGIPIDSFISTLIYINLSLISAFVCTAIVEKFNRKTLMIISAVGVCLTNLMAAFYEFSFDGATVKPLYWFPLFCIWSGVGFGMIGVNTLPWLMAGELFPSQVRGIMTGVLWVTVYLYIFIAVKTFPLLIPYIKIYGFLGIFSLSGFVCVILGKLILPETRGKTLIEIESFW